jgi:hypothetical protein
MVFRALGLHLMSVGPREGGPTVKEIRMAYNVCGGRQTELAPHSTLSRRAVQGRLTIRQGAACVASSPVTFSSC